MTKKLNNTSATSVEIHTFFRRVLTRLVFFTANIATMILLIREALIVFTSNQNTVRNVKVFILEYDANSLIGSDTS